LRQRERETESVCDERVKKRERRREFELDRYSQKLVS
jgi:hypothetical protein